MVIEAPEVGNVPTWLVLLFTIAVSAYDREPHWNRKFQKGQRTSGATPEIGFEDSAIGFLTIQCGQLLSTRISHYAGVFRSGIAVTAGRDSQPI